MNTKAYTSVSLPTELVEAITEAASLADRSVPKQIEHCFRLTMTLEEVLPPKTVNDAKAGTMPAIGLLDALRMVLANPVPVKRTGYRISMYPFDMSKHMRIAPDDTIAIGTIDGNGNFIPDNEKAQTPS